MISNKTITGIFWNFLEQCLRRGVTVIVTLLLAYFLSPDDYGIIAMLSLFLALGNALVESGFKQALIRKKNLTKLELSSVFYSNILLSLIAYVILFFTAPKIALFYDETRLVELIRFSGLLLILNSFHIVQTALFSKGMNFKVLLKANLPASFFSGFLAVILAYLGCGVWSLLFQMFFSSILISSILWFKSTWRPSFCFSFSSLKEMYLFGYKLLISSVLDIFAKNIAVVLIIKYFSVSLAGLYFFADRIKELLVSQLITSIQTVTYSSLSQLQHDDTRLIQAYKKILKLMSFIIFPTLLLFASVTPLIFEVFLPVKWASSAPFLQIMCVTSLIIPLISVNLNIIKVKGRSDWYLLLELIKKITGITTLLFTIGYGVEAVLIGQCVNLLVNYIPSVLIANKLVKYSLKDQFKDFFPSLLLSVLAGCISILLQSIFDLQAILILMLSLSVSIALYFFLAFALKMQSAILFISLLKSTKNSAKMNYES